MAKIKKVLSASNLPTKLPLTQSVFYWMCLDYWNAPQWVWGAVGLFTVFLWVNAIYKMATQEEFDIFDRVKESEPRKTFAERLKEKQDIKDFITKLKSLI